MWGPDDTTDLLYVWVCGPGEGGGGGYLAQVLASTVKLMLKGMAVTSRDRRAVTSHTIKF